MIDKDEILRTAALARLGLRADELEQLASEMTRILAFVDRVRGLDQATMSAVSAPLDGADALRPDVARPGLERDDALRNAPSVIEGFFRVPRVIAEP